MIFVANIYILVYFQHEEDRNQAYFPKFVVLFGLFFAEITVLMLPFDVAVSGYGDGHRESMEILWQVMYMLLAVLLILVIPFALFYYEAWDPDRDNRHQMVQACQFQACLLVVVVLTLVLMYLFLGTADVPVWKYTSTLDDSGTGNWEDITLPQSGSWCPDAFPESMQTLWSACDG